MAWDEWEQLKKEAAEASNRDVGRDTAETDAAGRHEAEALRRMDRIRKAKRAFRDTTVLVPLAPFGDGTLGFLTTDFGGVRWIQAFTDESTAVAFDAAQGRWAAKCDFMAIKGWRLLDELIPALEVPCGVALDPGGGHGVLLPPVRGIVPDAVALDAR